MRELENESYRAELPPGRAFKVEHVRIYQNVVLGCGVLSLVVVNHNQIYPARVYVINGLLSVSTAIEGYEQISLSR